MATGSIVSLLPSDFGDHPYATEYTDQFNYFVSAARPGSAAEAAPSAAAAAALASAAAAEVAGVEVAPDADVAAPDAAAEEDWIMVEKPKYRPRPKTAPSGEVTRFLTDTTFASKYNKPLPHAYGRVNTKPAARTNFMRTHNVCARPPNQVYAGAVRRRKERSATMLAAASRAPPRPLPPAKIKKAEENEAAPAAAEDTAAQTDVVDDQCVEGSVAAAVPALQMSKPKDPSMFELLTWDDPDETPSQPQTRSLKQAAVVVASLPPPPPAAPAAATSAEAVAEDGKGVVAFVPVVRSDRDPRNFACLPPSFIGAIKPAGCPIPRSEPAVSLIYPRARGR